MLLQSDAFNRKLEAFSPLGAEELSALERLQGPRFAAAAGEEIVYEGQEHHAAYVLCEGWAYSSKRLPNGSRQILDIHVAGDFLGLRSVPLRAADQSIVMLTNAELTKINTQRLIATATAAPRLATALLWAVSRDEARMAEHLVSVGKRSAMARTAHFLLELEARMRLIGRSSADSCDFPISQSVLADALGITAIHLNRVLRQLRERGHLVFRNGRVMFLNKERLVELTGFDRSYLELGTSNGG